MFPRFFARRAMGAVVTLCGVTLVGCSSDAPIEDVTWQITNIYQQGYPSDVPDDVAVAPRIIFGYTSVVGDTGCAPFHAHIEYTTDDGTKVEPLSATKARFSDVRVDDVRQGCIGREAFVHDSLVSLLPHEFSIDRQPGKLLLTQTGPVVDAPALLLISEQS
ncbi:hypothetical protein [Corynebacterium aquilae]|uniref:hypothetical protein n=1 Tax=Corynebacterium aquilae TaxID=203263 RepID=UPI0009532E95|nr:hypothetical protein [Corynebacterium aquilae]